MRLLTSSLMEIWRELAVSWGVQVLERLQKRGQLHA